LERLKSTLSEIDSVLSHKPCGHSSGTPALRKPARKVVSYRSRAGVSNNVPFLTRAMSFTSEPAGFRDFRDGVLDIAL
jgi:hypothetical protein